MSVVDNPLLLAVDALGDEVGEVVALGLEGLLAEGRLYGGDLSEELRLIVRSNSLP